jgi:hypothetical protein
MMKAGLEMELTRVPGDRRLYALGDVGTLRLEGLLMRAATGNAGRDSWRFARRGFWQRTIEASDPTGRVVGTFTPHDLRRGGHLRWHDIDYALRPHSNWRERYVLVDGERELALLKATGWWGWGTRTPVRLNVPDLRAVDPGLLLFTTFVVRSLANATDSNAATTATVTTTTSSGG